VFTERFSASKAGSAEITFLSRFENREVVCVVNENAAEEAHRQQSVGLGSAGVLAAIRSSEELHLREFNFPNGEVLGWQGRKNLLGAIGTTPQDT
jgi:hypothetical protein